MQQAIQVAARSAYLVVRCVFRQRQQCVENTVFRLGQFLAFGRREKIAHFLLGDLDTLVHVAGLNALDDHFPAHLLAHGGVGLALLLQRCAEVREAHAVLRRNPLHGLVQLGVRYTRPHPVAQLQLDALQNQPIQGFTDQDVFRGHFDTPRLQALGNGGNALAQLAGHDHIVVNDRHHLIENLGLCLRLANNQ